MTFAQRLKEEMEKRKLTAYRLAEMSGVHQTTVKNLLNGAKPQKKTVEKIAVALGVNEEYLLTGGKKSPPSDVEDGQEAELLSLIRKLTPDQRQRQIEFLRDIVGYSNK